MEWKPCSPGNRPNHAAAKGNVVGRDLDAASKPREHDAHGGGAHILLHNGLVAARPEVYERRVAEQRLINPDGAFFGRRIGPPAELDCCVLGVAEESGSGRVRSGGLAGDNGTSVPCNGGVGRGVDNEPGVGHRLDDGSLLLEQPGEFRVAVVLENREQGLCRGRGGEEAEARQKSLRQHAQTFKSPGMRLRGERREVRGCEVRGEDQRLGAACVVV